MAFLALRALPTLARSSTVKNVGKNYIENYNDTDNTKSGSGSGFLSFLLFIIIGLGIIFGLVWFFKFRNQQRFTNTNEKKKYYSGI